MEQQDRNRVGGFGDNYDGIDWSKKGNTPCGITQDIESKWNEKCVTCTEYPDCRWHSYYPDSEKILCNFLGCDWGCGLAGSGWCGGGGNCFNKDCPKFTDVNTKPKCCNCGKNDRKLHKAKMGDKDVLCCIDCATIVITKS